MRHEITDLNISGHEVTLFTESNPESVLIQPVDSHDMEEMSKEIEYIEHHCNHNFVLAAVKINKWNEELTPWPAPPVFGKIPFGDGAGKTLCFITEILLPFLTIDTVVLLSTAFLTMFSKEFSLSFLAIVLSFEIVDCSIFLIIF